MKDSLYKDLLTSIEEAGSIRREESSAERVSIFSGNVLVEVRENGRTTWSLEQAAEQLRRLNVVTVDPKSIREALRQTQEGFAELLGISIRTLQNWEQGRRDPRGPAQRLLHIASRNPVELLAAMQA